MTSGNVVAHVVHDGLLKHGLRAIFEPESVAVIGASRTPGSFGNTLFRNVFRSGFTGRVFPVNINADHVAGVQAYRTIAEVPGVVDLAVVCVPAAGVLPVVKECIAAKVRGLLVISAGFADAGVEGMERQRELVEMVRSAGIRLVGPNSLGLANLDPDVSLVASFAPAAPPSGSFGLVTQSGAVAVSVIDACRAHGVGLSGFISTGNKADVSGNDVLEYWAGDRRTKVILMYLESFGDPRRFNALTRRIAITKPIVAVKSGRTAVGGKAAASHSAALVSNDLTVDALFKQSGVLRVDTVSQMMNVARLLEAESLPAGRRVAIVTNSGGPGVMAADACAMYGMKLAELQSVKRLEMTNILSPAASTTNPVDMTAGATAAQYERVLRLVLNDPGVDAVVVVHTALSVNRPEVVAQAINGATLHSAKPVLANFIGGDDGIESLLRSRNIVNYESVEDAVFALSKACDLADWRRRAMVKPMTFSDADVTWAQHVVSASPARHNGGWLRISEIAEIFEAFNIPLVTSQVATGADAAVEVANHIGYPVVLKTADPHFLHKTEIGGVALDIRNDDELRSAFVEMQRRIGPEHDEVVVQPMVTGGIEMIAGGIEDPLFGPVVVAGLGGVDTEVLQDRVACLAPLSYDDTYDAVRSLRSSKLLFGHRGTEAVDVAAYQELLGRLGALMDAVPDITDVDCNPVMVTADGVHVLDAKVRIKRDAGS